APGSHAGSSASPCRLGGEPVRPFLVGGCCRQPSFPGCADSPLSPLTTPNFRVARDTSSRRTKAQFSILTMPATNEYEVPPAIVTRRGWRMVHSRQFEPKHASLYGIGPVFRSFSRNGWNGGKDGRG